MKTKTEKNIHGIDCDIESYYHNGQLWYRSEWNADRTETNVVESYYQDGQLDYRCEWDVARMKTLIVERYNHDGKLIEMCVWNSDRTDTCKVEQGIHNTTPAPVEVKESNKLLEAIATLYTRKLISAPETIELLRNL